MNSNKTLLIFGLCVSISPLLWAAETIARDATTVSTETGTAEQRLYLQSIRSTKQSVDQEILEVLYKDAQELYQEKEYAQASAILDRIYSIDPNYGDVATLRAVIQRAQQGTEVKNQRGPIEDAMKLGNAAYALGQRSMAITHWKRALVVNPNFAPAKRRIKQANEELAKKEYEEGYLNYQADDKEGALEHWSNALALNPDYKRKGLLQLVTKTENELRRKRGATLVSQADQQFQSGQLAEALATYEEILKMEPRNAEGRQRVNMIRIQLGRAAYQSARQAYSEGLYAKAIKEWERSKTLGYEVVSSEKSIKDTEAKISQPPVVAVTRPRPKPVVTPPAALPPVTVDAPKVEASDEDKAEALKHYQEGMVAIRAKDYHLAVEELKQANQLHPGNDRYYMALQRAEQAWAGADSAPKP